MPHIITRRLEFDAAHRVLGHENKCKHLHGHRYRAEITFEAGLDNLGRVIDFGVVKQIVGKWIDDNWDHNIILNSWDEFAKLLQTGSFEKTNGRRIYVLNGRNPTAENMSEELFKQCVELLKDSAHVTVLKVRIYETPNCWADYTP